MDVQIALDWKDKLGEEFKKPYFINLIEFVKKEYKDHICYPLGKDIFSAFWHCSFDQTKVVILGQDPYHGQGQANGLCFSVKKGIALPPSLVNIFKEIKEDLKKPFPLHGDLTHWSDQGVFLLNATLTVRAHSPGSHQNKGWEVFTDAIIKKLSMEKENLVFLLWGSYAQKKEILIDEKKHYILKSTHPSPFSAHRGFLGSHHFSKTNIFLKEKGMSSINW